MPSYDVSTVKRKQDELESRKNKLLESFKPFRDEFIGRLEQFISEAARVGLKGVKPLKRKEDTAERLVATVTLNEDDLVLIATDAIYFLSFRGRTLATKILIYIAGNESYTPREEIIFGESSEGPYQYFMNWFTTDGPKPIRSRGGVTAGAGKTAAEHLLEHIYNYRRAWNEKPSLHAMLEGKGYELPPLGFRTEK